IVAPATFNTINKLAIGIADNYALDVVNEAVRLGLPVAILPFVNSAHVARKPFQRSVELLRQKGVLVSIGTELVEPHKAKGVEVKMGEFPWKEALARIDKISFM